MATSILAAALLLVVQPATAAEDHGLLARTLIGTDIEKSIPVEQDHLIVRYWVMSWTGEVCESRLRVGGARAPSTWIIDWRKVQRIVASDDGRPAAILFGSPGVVTDLGNPNSSETTLPTRIFIDPASPAIRAMERLQAACAERP